MADNSAAQEPGAGGFGAAADATTMRGIGLMVLAMFVLACMDTISKHLASSYPVPQILSLIHI